MRRTIKPHITKKKKKEELTLAKWTHLIESNEHLICACVRECVDACEFIINQGINRNIMSFYTHSNDSYCDNAIDYFP